VSARAAAPESSSVVGREGILGAGIRLFRERGYNDVSIRALAAEAGCSTANLYHHFSSKYEIFVSIIEGAMGHHQAGLDRALAEHDEPVGQLRAALRHHLRLHLTDTDVRLLSRDFHPLTGPELERFIAERDRYEHGIRDIVARGISSGAFAVDDPAVTVRAALSACTDVDRWFHADGALTADQVTDRISGFLLQGFIAAPAPAEGGA
jgi:AcrR family transcriptional regulator